MIPRRRFALAILLGAIVVALALSLSGPREPSYQGRPLSAWTEDLMGNPSEARGRAVQAIEHMGSNAMPRLVRMMQRRDSRLRVKLADWINSHCAGSQPAFNLSLATSPVRT